MAGGIDWFRWHHGTVTDQKFPLVARRAGASVAECIAVWACLLESASMNEAERGSLGSEPDFEAMDCALGLPDGRAKAIFEAMQQRALVSEDLGISAWAKRQPKRERQDENSTERSRAFRAKQRQATPESADATPCNARQRTETPRVEKSREEKYTPLPPSGEPAEPAGFARFWSSWPKSERKGGKAKCLQVWWRAKLEGQSDAIFAHVKAMSLSSEWQRESGAYIPAPLVYLNQRRWDGAEVGSAEQQDRWAGAL